MSAKATDQLIPTRATARDRPYYTREASRRASSYIVGAIPRGRPGTYLLERLAI